MQVLLKIAWLPKFCLFSLAINLSFSESNALPVLISDVLSWQEKT